MQTMQVPYCCGVDFLYGFLFTDQTINATSADVEEWLDKEILNTINRYKYFMNGTPYTPFNGHSERPIKILILNSRQNQYMEEMLKKRNFKLIAKERNSNSSNDIYFYLLNVVADLKKRKS